MRRRATISPPEGLLDLPDGGSGRPVHRRRTHGARKIYRAVEGVYPVGPEFGVAQRSSAPDAGTSAQSAARRQGRPVRQPDPRGRRRPGDRIAARSRPNWRASPRSRAAAPARYICRRNWRACATRPRRSPRRPAMLCHRRAAVARAGDGQGNAVGQGARRCRVNPQNLNAAIEQVPQGPQGRQRLGRGQATTR